jgi:hypothetical protein
MNFPEIEWCRLLRGTKGLPMIDILLADAEKVGKDVTEVCSRTGEMKVSNYSLNDSAFASKFPAGDYRVEFKFFDDIDDNIYNLTFFAKFIQ